jgi:predicted enzyme related to lactoylglutathione lyase
MFRTAGSLLLVCSDALLGDLDGKEVAAALAGEAVLSIHVATDGEVDAAAQEVASAGGVVVKPAAPTPLGRCAA